MPSRVFILEDHAMMREQLTGFLQRINGFEVCGSSATAEEALQLVPQARSDLVLVDISLPGMNGLDFIAELQKSCPEVACLVLSGQRSKDYCGAARQAGARGFVSKGNVPRLREALRKVLTGESYFEECD